MVNRVIGVFLSALVVGCTGSREMLQIPPAPTSRLSALSLSSFPHVKTQIDALLADSLFPPSNVGIRIVSLTRGEHLYSLNDNMLFNPASNEKLLTTATALMNLGTSYGFSTAVFADTLRHRVILKGYGDPLTSTADLDSLARRVAPYLSWTAPWRVAVDVSFFDDLSWGAGWNWDEEPAACGQKQEHPL